MSAKASKPATTTSEVCKNFDRVMGGQHMHWVDPERSEVTSGGGDHSHLFIIDGKIIMSEYDGSQHRHRLDASEVGVQILPHEHGVFVNNKYYQTNGGGAHEHSSVDNGMIDGSGEHRHRVELADGRQIESCLAKDFISVEIRKSQNIDIQSLFLKKDRFMSFEQAANWASERGFAIDKFQERDGFFLFTQSQREEFNESSLQTVKLFDGVEAVIGFKKFEENAGDVDASAPGQRAQATNQLEPDLKSFSDFERLVSDGHEVLNPEQAEKLSFLKDEFAGQISAFKDALSQVLPRMSAFAEEIRSANSISEEFTGLVERLAITMDIMGEELAKATLPVEKSATLPDDLDLALGTLQGLTEQNLSTFEGTTFENFELGLRVLNQGIKKFLSSKGESVTKQSPRRDMDRETLKQLQDERVKKFGIEVVEGSSLTFPSGFPTDLGEYGDPVNLKFPTDTAARARNARVRFKQFANTIYSETDSKKIVHERIVKAELKFGVKVTIDKSDSLDKLLPSELLERDDVEVIETTVTKNEDFRLFVPIIKSATEERTIFGIVLEPLDEKTGGDLHGDVYDGPTVIKAADKFMEDFQNVGLMHQTFVNDKVHILQSFTAPGDIELAGGGNPVKIRKDTWLMKARVIDDDIWSAVKSGKITGFSIGAIATVQEL